MDLKGKRLLLMGGGAFIKDIRQYADQNGIYLIAVGNPPGAHSLMADESYVIDTQDVDAISNLIIAEHIDGVFIGANEANIPPAIKVAERTGLNFYCSQQQWDILSNKATFKKLLQKHDMPLIPSYNEWQDFKNIVYPVIVKPIDGSGAKGITVCNSYEEIESAIAYAKKFSPSCKVIIEQYMQGMDDTFIRYHFQNGRYSISGSFDKYADFSMGGFAGMPLLYMHPTKHLDAYRKKIDKKMQNLFADLGLRTGVITLQGFVDDNEDFYFYEAGYRLGGSQSYIFTDAINNSNSLHYMINHALTGQMADYCIAERDKPFNDKVCCNQYIPLNAGTIAVIEGLDELRNTPGVLNITEMCKIGSVIRATGDLNQVCLRMHLMGNDRKALDQILAVVDDKLQILDETGKDMRMRHVRCVDDVMK